MNSNLIGKVVVWALAFYFIISGLLAAFDVDAKLIRIGLSAVNDDGKIAFILIYTSMMVGVGVAMLFMLYMFKSCRPSLVLAGTIVFSFIIFRIIGSFVIGEFSSTQIGFLLTEVVELVIILVILFKVGKEVEVS
jgi:hypothetical protein